MKKPQSPRNAEVLVPEIPRVMDIAKRFIVGIRILNLKKMANNQMEKLLTTRIRIAGRILINKKSGAFSMSPLKDTSTNEKISSGCKKQKIKIHVKLSAISCLSCNQPMFLS